MKKEMKGKIVYIIGGLTKPNGMAQVLSQKVNYLAENTDYEIYVVLTEEAGTPWYYKLSQKIKYVNFDINFDELDTMPTFKKIYHYNIKQKKYKKVLSNYLINLRADIVVSAMRRDINFLNDIPDGSKKIGEIHFNKSNYREFNKRFLPQWINKAITHSWRGKLIKEIKRLDEFIVLTQEDRAEWTELEKVKVIHNSISYFPEKQSDCSTSTVIAAGRYTWQKGFDLLIDAWNIVHKKHPDWLLNIYGSGDNNSFQELANGKGLKDTIVCHPSTPHIYEKFQESSIFVLSSRYEGMVLVLIEAMSCGVPAVSFACPCGPKDIITNGKDGLLVENGNVQQLAEKICYLIEHENERKEMGRKAQESSKRFKQEVIMKQWIELFDAMVEN
ncbi:glycosyltransferase family 4 protein [Phocaeicola sp.]